MKYDTAWHEGGLSYAILPLMFATCKLIAAAHSYADRAFVDAKVSTTSSYAVAPSLTGPGPRPPGAAARSFSHCPQHSAPCPPPCRAS